MIRMIRDYLHTFRCRFMECHERKGTTRTERYVSGFNRLDRVEHKLDDMIIRKAGRDFYDLKMYMESPHRDDTKEKHHD